MGHINACAQNLIISSTNLNTSFLWCLYFVAFNYKILLKVLCSKPKETIFGTYF